MCRLTECTNASRAVRNSLLKELRAADAKELTALRSDVEAPVRALHKAQTENRQLRQQLAAPDPKVRSLPTQPRPRASRGRS
ncbi:hypothetical protein [Streptomyces sp. IMTB 2501]|uniref:hypothetical protein n=1 Tax=Streptomyces sp. IMTB 2501 TaxID=1776340 RepID=UPI0015B946EA|nr:hypothetical protein [Streptomyces sp. IMTB 2501]